MTPPTVSRALYLPRYVATQRPDLIFSLVSLCSISMNRLVASVRSAFCNNAINQVISRLSTGAKSRWLKGEFIKEQ